MTVQRDVASIGKINSFWPRKLKSQIISSAWWLSFMYYGKVLTIGAIILSKQLEMSSARQLQAETMGRPRLLGLWIL